MQGKPEKCGEKQADLPVFPHFVPWFRHKYGLVFRPEAYYNI